MVKWFWIQDTNKNVSCQFFLHVGVSTKCELNQIYWSDTNLVPCLASGATLTIQFVKSQVEAVPQFLWNFAAFLGKHRPSSAFEGSFHWCRLEGPGGPNIGFKTFFSRPPFRKRTSMFSKPPPPVRWVMFIDMAQGSTPEDGRQVTTKGVLKGGYFVRIFVRQWSSLQKDCIPLWTG